MPKSKKPVQSPFKGPNDEGGRFVARDLRRVNPKREQFAPTPAEPVRLRYKMAGGC